MKELIEQLEPKMMALLQNAKSQMEQGGRASCQTHIARHRANAETVPKTLFIRFADKRIIRFLFGKFFLESRCF